MFVLSSNYLFKNYAMKNAHYIIRYQPEKKTKKKKYIICTSVQTKNKEKVSKCW